MTVTSPEAVTMRSVLLAGGDAPAALRAALDGARLAGAAAARTPLGRALRHAAAAEVAGHLDVDAIGVLTEAWRLHGDLAAAARRTAAEPGTSDRVRVSRQTVTWARDLSVEFYVDGEPQPGPLVLVLRLVFVIAELEAVISGGRLTALESSTCELTASLGVRVGEEVVDILSRAERLNLAIHVALGQGLPLVSTSPPQTRAERRPRQLAPRGVHLVGESGRARADVRTERRTNRGRPGASAPPPR